jgi:hypothetical protein
LSAKTRPLAADHVAHFYADDTELGAAVVEHLAPTLASGGTTVLIATPSRCEGILRELRGAGSDLRSAENEGRLLVFAAAGTIARVMVDGVPDAAAFGAVIGCPLREARSRGHRVVAFSEMGEMLWDSGDVLSALDVERLWNALGETIPFSLLCGYRRERDRFDESTAPLVEVCSLHSRVGHAGFAVMYPADAGSVPVARLRGR